MRLVRDPKTHLGKGIGYVMFATKEEMAKALDEKKEMKFKGRPLRIQRAVAPKRREKKQIRKDAKLAERRAKKDKSKRENAEDPLLPRNFEDAYSSEDSEDEKMKKRKAKR